MFRGPGYLINGEVETMGHKSSKAARRFTVVAICLAVVGGLVWWQREPLMTWYGLLNLEHAQESDRAKWVEWLAGCDKEAVTGLIDWLRRDDTRVCAAAEQTLSALAERWGNFDQRTTVVADELVAQWTALSTPGREATLEWFLARLHTSDARKAPSPALAGAAAKLLSSAATIPEKGVRLRSLALAEVLLGRGQAAHVDLCRKLAHQGMAGQDADITAAAIRLVMHAPLHSDQALVTGVVPFLKHSAAPVRRAAVLAVGLAEETIAVQDMLPLLQDPDADVRRLCEAALRGRGLQDSHIKLAKLITDSRPAQRMQVVHYLHQAEDLDPGIWLRHLSQDPSPAVRAAAIRLAAEDPAAVNFQEQMTRMAREDDSPTVRQLAEFYLKKQKR
jgi:hypothetical protein